MIRLPGRFLLLAAIQHTGFIDFRVVFLIFMNHISSPRGHMHQHDLKPRALPKICMQTQMWCLILVFYIFTLFIFTLFSLVLSIIFTNNRFRVVFQWFAIQHRCKTTLETIESLADQIIRPDRSHKQYTSKAPWLGIGPATNECESLS